MKKQLFLSLLLLTGVSLHGVSDDYLNITYKDGTTVAMDSSGFLTDFELSLGQPEENISSRVIIVEEARLQEYYKQWPNHDYKLFKRSYFYGLQWAAKKEISSVRLQEIANINMPESEDGIPTYEKINFSNEENALDFLRGLITGHNDIVITHNKEIEQG